MCWIEPASCFAILRSNTRIEAWRIVKGALRLIKSVDSDISDAVGLVTLDSTSVLCYGSSGTTRSFCMIDDVSSGSPMSAISLDVRGPVEYAAYKDNIFASGGNNNDVQLWDVSTGTRKWAAKNVPHDEVRLAVPIWITAISFFSAESTCGSNVIATGTAYKHVRLYDIRVKRQPILSWEVGEFRVTRVRAVSPYGDAGPATVCIADCGGNMHCRDIRTGKVTTTYGSAGGSFRDVSLAVTEAGEDGSMVASVSLDRYLRLHEVGRSELVYKAYLKNRLNCCLCVGDEGRGGPDGSSVGDDDVLQEYVDSDDDQEEDEESGDDEDENEEGEEGDGSGEEEEDGDGLEQGMDSESASEEEEEQEEEDDEEDSDSDSDSEESELEEEEKAVGKGGKKRGSAVKGGTSSKPLPPAASGNSKKRRVR
jgi:hypothetical protein